MSPSRNYLCGEVIKNGKAMLRKSDRSGNLFRYWWVSLVVGVLGIATGVACVVVPADSLAVLTVFFVSVLVVGGIFNIAWAVANRNWNDTWGWSLARGLIEVLLGVWLMLLPLPLVTTLLIYVVGFWMLFQSVLGICESCALAPFRGTGWGWLLACNILSLICSFVFWLRLFTEESLSLPASARPLSFTEFSGLCWLLSGVGSTGSSAGRAETDSSTRRWSNNGFPELSVSGRL